MKNEHLISGALIYSLSCTVVSLAQWIISVLIARINGFVDAGIFSLAMSVSNVFMYIANYSIRNVQVSDTKQEYTQSQYLLSRLLSCGISIAACIIYLLIAENYTSTEKWAVFIYLIYSDIYLLNDVMIGTFQINGHIEIGGYSNLLLALVCSAAFFIGYLTSGAMIVGLVMMALGSLTVVICFSYSRYKNFFYGFSSFIKDLKMSVTILKKCFLLMISGVLPLVTTLIPRRQIQIICGEEQLGYFSSIFAPTVIITVIIPPLILSIVPNLSGNWNSGRINLFAKTVTMCYGLIFATTLFASVAAIFLGKPIMGFVFGKEILQYFDLLYWAIAATGLNAVSSCGNIILTAMRKNITVTVSAALSIIIVILLSANFVKNYGVYGAAYSLLIAYAVQAVFQLVMILFFTMLSKRKNMIV